MVGGLTLSGGIFIFGGPSKTNGLYQMLATTNLIEPFAPLGAAILSSGTNTSYTNPVIREPAQFFRLQETTP